VRAAIVCGPREGTGAAIVRKALDQARADPTMPRFHFIVVGSDVGTDKEAYEWALAREMPALTCPARWKTGRVTGAPEGPIRNQAMYDWQRPVLSVVLGFPGNRGTSNMMGIGCGGGTPSFWYSLIDELWLRDERSVR
jgi:YspA, cpYpsA-related SLOG family